MNQEAAAGARAPIGVFDSGVGGLSILRALRAQLPAEDFVYFADSGHAPYGERDEAFVAGRARAIASELIGQHGIKLLVVACNTATAAAVRALREAWPDLPIVGVEPALKPAAQGTRTGHVAVMATRGTLGSEKFRQLLEPWQAQAAFRLQPCDGLAAAIEAHDAQAIDTLCARYVAALGPFGTGEGQADTLVLGCTHYAFAQPVLERLVGPGITILETGEPVARQTRRLLLAAGSAREEAGRQGRVLLLSSGDVGALECAHARWLGPT